MHKDPPETTSLQESSSGISTSIWRIVLAYGIVALFVGLCAYHFYTHREDFAFLANVSLPDLAAAGLCIGAAIFAGMYQLKPFFDHYGLPIGFLELLALTTTSSLGNLLLPMRGGTAALAFYLKKVHGMSFTDFSLTYAGTGILTVLTNSAFALIGLAVLFLKDGFFHLAISVIVVGLFGVCLVVIVFPPRIGSTRGGIWGLVGAAFNGWHALSRDRALFAKASTALIVVLLCITGSFAFLYRALGLPLSFFAVLVTLGVGNIATLVPVTPGSLGIFDAVTIQIPLIFGLDVARAIAATVLYRTLFLLWALILGIPGFCYLTLRVRRQGKETRAHAGDTEEH